ncbi:ABC-type transport system involved in multi-copper enzyme maturation permease subunit [Pseudarthrobacter sp. W1I19]|nr:ABC-type transport system involved in multi-copper enzyme maturation permease subunit [Pseudarthrobacter sp. W1I19]
MGTPSADANRPVDETKPPEAPPGPGAREGGAERKATHSLTMAVLAIISMIITAPLAMFAMLGTYPSDGPSPTPWVAPMVFFSLPLLFALPSLALAISVIRNSPDTSPARSSAAFALCISGLVFALALGPALDQLRNI